MSWQALRFRPQARRRPRGVPARRRTRAKKSPIIVRMTWIQEASPKPRVRRKMTRHHILAQSRGGGNEPENMLRLWNDSHELFHMLFPGNPTLIEAARILYTRAFGLERTYARTWNFRGEVYSQLFGKRSYLRAAELLLRADRAKRGQGAVNIGPHLFVVMSEARNRAIPALPPQGRRPVRISQRCFSLAEEEVPAVYRVA